MKKIKRIVMALMMTMMLLQLCACSKGANSEVKYQGIWVQKNGVSIDDLDSSDNINNIDLVLIDESKSIKRWVSLKINATTGKVYSFNSKATCQLLSSDSYVINTVESFTSEGNSVVHNVDQPEKKSISLDDKTSTVTGLVMDGQTFYPLDSFTAWNEDGTAELIEKFVNGQIAISNDEDADLISKKWSVEKGDVFGSYNVVDCDGNVQDTWTVSVDGSSNVYTCPNHPDTVIEELDGKPVNRGTIASYYNLETGEFNQSSN